MIGYLENDINLLIFHSSVVGMLSKNTSCLIELSLGHSVTKCQNVSFSSPHNLHMGSIEGSALNCI